MRVDYQLSTRPICLVVVIAAHIILMAGGVIIVYRVRLGGAELGLLDTALLLLAFAFFLNVYPWFLTVYRIPCALDSFISELYRIARIQKDDEPPGKPLSDKIDQLSYVTNTLKKNIRDIERAAEDMREQKNHLKAVLATITDVIVTMDKNGIIQMASPVVEELFGFNESDLIGKNIAFLLPSLPQKFFNNGDSAIVGQAQELEARRKDGSVFPADFSVIRIVNDGPHDFVGIIHDITQHKKNEEERDRCLHELENSNRELDDFAYIVSHDLKEPLRGLQSFHGSSLRTIRTNSMKRAGTGSVRSPTCLSVSKNTWAPCFTTPGWDGRPWPSAKRT